jgi:hypothetical protein
MQRELPEIVAAFNQDVEGAELHLLIMLARMQGIKGDPFSPRVAPSGTMTIQY